MMLGDTCKYCVMTYIECGFECEGSLEAVIDRCEKEMGFNQQFTLANRARLGLDLKTHLRSQVSMDLKQGLTMKVKLRGVTSKEFYDVKKLWPSQIGKKLKLLPTPSGRKFWGIVVAEDGSWGTLGVMYSIKRAVFASEQEIHMPYAEHHIVGQEQGAWKMLTDAGKGEAAEVQC